MQPVENSCLVRCHTNRVHTCGCAVSLSGTRQFAHGLQVEGCTKDIRQEKEYYQRYRICEEHLKLSSLLKDGVPQRFCQQCGRFHLVSEFDGDKRWVSLPSIDTLKHICSLFILIKHSWAAL